MNVLLDFSQRNRRARSFAAEGDLLGILSDYVHRTVREVIPSAVVDCTHSASETDAYLSERLGGSSPVMVVNPLNGPVTAKRLAAFLERQGTPSWLVSTNKIPVNANPLWLSLLPESQGQIRFFEPLLRMKQVRGYMADDATCVSKGKVSGSQFLPDLYLADNVITLYPERFCDEGDVDFVPYALAEDESAPIFYKLPTFQMSNDAAVEWPHDIDFKLLFRRVSPENCVNGRP